MIRGAKAAGVSRGLLELDGVTKSFGAVVATDDVTLSFDRGECHAIIGPNGSGKTTLFNVVTGFHAPDRGTVRFDGADITGLSPDRIARRGLVRTFQVVSPFGGLTVRENLLGVYSGRGRSAVSVPPETRERAEEVLSTLDLDHVADHAASDISGGQQKLLELGRVLMLDPACVLLDEPTAGVNPAIQDRVLATLRDLTDGGTTLVVIEHDMGVVGDLADRITVLDGGRVLTQGSFAEVTDDPRVQDAYLGRRSDGAAADADSTDDGEDAPHARPFAPAAAASEGAGDAEPDTHRLVVQDVVAGYGSQTVLDGVSVRSHDGVTCIFGPNGSGKSTLLKTIAGVVPARAGTVRYGDCDVTDSDPDEVVAAGITTVPQDERVFRGLTVRENLQLGATTVADDRVADERMDGVLDVFPALASSLSEPAHSLSGGQQVMLGVARAMMTGAEVYLLDEPFSGLAPSVVADVAEVVRSLAAQGTQVVLVEQQVREALELADHAYVLSQGEIRFDGAPSALRDDDELVDLYLGIG